MKEQRQPDGSYASVLATALGKCDKTEEKKSRVAKVTDAASCVSPGDLLKAAARKTYLEVMPRFLERHRVLPGELIFRTDLLETLEALQQPIPMAR